MDVRSTLATQRYARAKPATAATPGDAAGAARPSGGGFGAAVDGFARTVAAGEDTARAAMTGGADPQALVQALATSELAVETAVTLRDKVVEAYQEILRMQV